MHLLLILILLCLIVPAFARLLGSMVAGLFWLVVIMVVLTLFGAFSN